MKKMICMAVLFTLLFSMTACGSSQAGQGPGENMKAGISGPVQETAGEETTGEETAGQEPTGPKTAGQEATEQEATDMKMKIQVGDTTFTATLAENSSVDGLKELMADGPLTLNMSDYANMEKGADLGVTLPQNNEQMNTQAGDIILYQGRTFVIYYDTNSWSLTPIGKIDNVDADGLRKTLGTGDVTVILSMD